MERSTVEQERRVLMLWHAISELAPQDENPMRWAVGRTSMPFRRVDWARRIRNRVAHPDGNPLNPRDVARAGDIFEDLLKRLGATPPEYPEVDVPERPDDGTATNGAAADGPARSGQAQAPTGGRPGARRPTRTIGRNKVPVATIALMVVGIACTLSLWLALAGLPALVLSAIAMSKVYTDFSGAERLTRTGWIVFTLLGMITLAGLALRWAVQDLTSA